jgi:MFS family permease
MIGPIIAGAMTQHANWQSFWWLNVAAFGVLIILIIFAFPETKFINREAVVDKQLVDAGLKLKSEAGTSTPTGATTTAATSENAGEVDEAAIENTKSFAPMNTDAEIEALDPWLHKGYPGLHQFPTIWYPRLTKGNLAAALVPPPHVPRLTGLVA